MASIMQQKNGGYQIQFVDPDRRRRSVRLGKIKARSAQLIKLRIEQLVVNRKTGVANDAELIQWLNGITDELHAKLARVDLVASRTKHQAIELKAFLDAFRDRRKDVKPATREVWKQPMRNLIEYFGADRDIKSVTVADAMDFRQHLIGTKLAPTTVAKRLQFVRMFFNDARKRKLIRENPFAEVSAKSVIRLSERRFVTRQETDKLLDACTNHDWRTIVALARYGGLRCPSEVLSLRWQDIDWDGKRIIVPSPKTAHHGKETRIIPLFPELKVALDDAWEMAPEGAVYVVDEKYRLSANSKTGWRNCNLRTTFKKIVERAGLKPWPKLFHALRSSCETELAREYPIHVVTAWLGNTPSIALKHYLITTDEDFERAARGEPADVEPEKPASENVPEVVVQKAVQYRAEKGRSARQAESANVRNTKGSGPLRELAIGQNGDEGIRTLDLRIANATLSQLSYVPVIIRLSW